MKQHITIEQIPGGETKLNEQLTSWIFANDEEYYFKLSEISSRARVESEVEFDIEFSKYFTIGKMIEILDDIWTKDEVFISRLDNFEWNISFDLEVEYGYNCEFKGNELCNVLWQAIKYTLEGN